MTFFLVRVIIKNYHSQNELLHKPTDTLHSTLQEARGAAVGFFNWGVYVGYSFTFLLLIAERKIGWRAVYFIAGIPGVALGFLICFTVRDPPRRDGSNSNKVGDRGISPCISQSNWLIQLVCSKFLEGCAWISQWPTFKTEDCSVSFCQSCPALVVHWWRVEEWSRHCLGIQHRHFLWWVSPWNQCRHS